MSDNTLRYSQLLDKYTKQGLSFDEAKKKAKDKIAIQTVQSKLDNTKIRKSLMGENIGTRELINRLREGGLSDEEIEQSGVFKFRKAKPSRLELLRYGKNWYKKVGYKYRESK